MADPIIRVKRSTVQGKIPTVEQLGLGEIAINHYDAKLFIRQDTLGVGIGTTVVQIGVQGLQGIQGVQGTQGIQGVQGTDGIQGLQGVQGTQGIQGTQGVQGTDGIQGSIGAQGTTGTQGATGTQGTQGIQGIQGTIGSQGTTGTQGTQGTQGITGPVAGSANQVVYKDGSNNPTGSANLTFNGTELVTHTLTVLNNTDINGNLNVDGIITIGGTAAQLNTQQLTVADPDIVLGLSTTFSPTDITASHGGIAIASTEGTPIVSLAIGGETNPDTYKKIMWFRGGDIGAGYTDAWLFNYGVGIGSTQVPNGVRLAAGGMQVTDSTISSPQLNISGVSTFSGILELDAGLRDIYNNVGIAGSVLISTGTGVSWTTPFAAGIQGVQGTTGSQGATGSQGTTGTQGTDGTQGIQGTQGAIGSQGTTGPAGTNTGPDISRIANNYYFGWGVAPGTAGTRLVTASRVYYVLFSNPVATTWTRIGVRVGTSVASSLARLGVYAVGNTGLPTTLLQDFGTVSTASTGDREITISYTMDPGSYYLALICDSAVTFAGHLTESGMAAYVFGASSTTVSASIALWYETGSGSTLPSTANTTLTAEDTSLRRPMIWLRKV